MVIGCPKELIPKNKRQINKNEEILLCVLLSLVIAENKNNSRINRRDFRKAEDPRAKDECWAIEGPLKLLKAEAINGYTFPGPRVSGNVLRPVFPVSGWTEITSV